MSGPGKTVLLTGAGGFLGRHLSAVLTGRGHRVLAWARTAEEGRVEGRFFLPWGAERTALAEKGPVDAVIHAATCYGRRGEPVARVLEANLELPLRLARAALDGGIPLFLNTDTYFNRPGGYSFLSDYVASKRDALEWLRRASRAGAFRLANLRLEHLYGPGDPPDKFCAAVLRDCRGHRQEIDLTEGLQRRDFIYVEDAARAYAAVVEGWREPGDADFGVGRGESVPLRDFVLTGHRLAGSRSRLRFGAVPGRPDEIADSFADTSALRKLGWTPSTGLEEGIRKTLESFETVP